MSRVFGRVDPTTHGERKVLELLSQLDERWNVFYSVGFVDRQGFDRQREIDFIASHPEKGLLFIEVKGGKVKFDGSGNISQWLESNWKVITPELQLNNARRVCLEFLKANGIDAFVPARNVYIFPFTKKPTSGLSQELQTCSIFQDDIDELPNVIPDLLDDLRKDVFDNSIVEKLLTPCLVRVAAPEHIEENTNVSLAIPSLTSIANCSAEDFTSMRDIRSALLTHRESLQSIWWDVINRKSVIETTIGHEIVQDDSVISLLQETQSLVSSSFVEIGVFGQVKRGKSTLVNALVGRQVSAVGMLPKTAIPVTIQHSVEEGGTIELNDGSTVMVSLDDALFATTQESRKKRISDGKPSVERVTVSLDVDWLPSEARIVDTPGLSDPGQSADYESYALNELDRVSAAIFVISYPPGIEQHEIQIISALASHGIAKVFFVVNMWSDMWKKKGAKQEAAEFVQNLVVSSQTESSQIDPKDSKVYVVNLGMATDAIESGKVKKLQESGITELRDVVEQYLAIGALSRIAGGGARRLLSASVIIDKTLSERKETILNPVLLEKRREELKVNIESSEEKLTKIKNIVSAKIEALTLQLIPVISEPFDSTIQRMSSNTSREQLRNVQSSLGLKFSSAMSALTTKFQRGIIEISDEAKSNLISSLGVTTWEFSTSGLGSEVFSTSFMSESMIASYRPPSDFKIEGLAAGATIGALLVQGATAALIFTNPVGLLVAALLGGGIGLAGGKFASDKGNGQEASTEEIQRLTSKILEAKAESIRKFQNEISLKKELLLKALKNTRDSLLMDADYELKNVEVALRDEKSKKSALSEISDLHARLIKVVGGLEV